MPNGIRERDQGRPTLPTNSKKKAIATRISISFPTQVLNPRTSFVTCFMTICMYNFHGNMKHIPRNYQWYTMCNDIHKKPNEQNKIHTRPMHGAVGADGRERGRGNRRKLSRWRHCDVSKTEKLHRFRPVELAIAGDAGDSPSVGLQSPSFTVSQFPSCSSNSAFIRRGHLVPVVEHDGVSCFGFVFRFQVVIEGNPYLSVDVSHGITVVC